MMRPMKLRYWLFLAFTLVAALPPLTLGFWLKQPALQNEINGVSEKHLLMAKGLAASADRYAQDLVSVFRFALNSSKDEPASEPLRSLLDQVSINSIVLLEPDGKSLTPFATADDDGIVLPPGILKTITSLSTSGEVTISDVLPGPDGKPALYLVMPIPGDKLAIGIVNTSHLQALQQAISFGELGHAAIVDRSGKVLSHPNKDWTAQMKDISTVDPVAQMIQGETGVSFFFSPAVKADMVAGYTVVPSTGWGAMVPQPMSELEHNSSELLGDTLKIIGIGLLIAGLVSWWLAGYLSKSVLAVSHAARDVAGGGRFEKVRLGKTTPAELSGLAASFNAMVSQISSTNRELTERSVVLRATVDNLAEGVAVVDGNGELLLANQRFSELFRLPVSITEKHTAFEDILRYLDARSDFAVYQDGLEKQLKCLSTTEPWQDEIPLSNGVILEQRCNPLPDGGQVISYIEVTDRKRLEHTLRELHSISVKSAMSLSDRLKILLESGCRQFNLAVGILARVDGDRYEVVEAVDPNGALFAGAVLNYGDTYCSRVLKQSDPVAFEHAAASAWKAHPCYKKYRVEAYLGVAVTVGGKLYGGLSFSSDEPHTAPFTAVDKELLRLMAQWVGSELARNQAEQALSEEKERAQVTLESIGDAVIAVDANDNIEYLNLAAQTLTGRTLADARGQQIEAVLHLRDEDDEGFSLNTLVSGKAEENRVLPKVLVLADGTQRIVETSSAPLLNRESDLIGRVLVFRDVTRAREMTRQIASEAIHDSLTGLINRREFERRLTDALSRAHEHGAHHALCYLDLDQFKVINDTCGHVAGDTLLKQLGSILPARIRKEDTLARLGGDEFGVLVLDCPLVRALEVAHEIHHAIEDFHFVWQGNSFRIGASIGLVPISAESGNVASILSNADRACYAAKESGRNRVQVYREGDAELARRRGEMQWMVKLPRALQEDKFRLFYQPIASVSGASDWGLHYELLLRLEADDGTLILPGAFLPAAENYGLANRIDRWVVSEALHQLALHREHLEALHMCSINLSGLSLGDPSFLTFLIRLFKETAVPTEKICFEITETVAIANLSSAIRFIGALKKMGCRFALDDFGSGLSSFGYLKSLPVDYLKIDGVFVKDIAEDPIDLAMVKSINEIGKVMGKMTIAEYVESDAILHTLNAIGVDFAQGYLFGKPAPMAQLFEMEDRAAKTQSGSMSVMGKAPENS